MNERTVLVVAHGSREASGNAETAEFVARWRQMRPQWRIELCFIEHAEILLDEGLDRAAEGAREVVVLPLILNAAGHVKMELPEAIERARARHPQVHFVARRHLGMGAELFPLIQQRLQEALRELDVPDPATTGVILLGRGSSDPGGNAELAKMARWVFEANDHELVDLAFTGITWPRLETVVARQVRLGMMQIAIVPVYLFTGVLIERIGAQVDRLRRQYPRVAFALARHFGFDERLVALLEARVGEEGREGMLECDGCKYRAAAAHEHAHAHHHG